MHSQERRSVIRWQVGKEVKLKLEGAQAFTACQLKDINFRGIQVALTLKLPKDTFLKLALVVTEGFVLNIEAWIVWQRVIGGFNVYGLYFSKIRDLDKEKIYQFIRRDFPEQVQRQWWQGIRRGGENMQDAKFEDRRIFARFSAKFPLRFLDLKSGREACVQTYNISAKGIGILTKERLEAHTPLELWLEVPDKGEPLYIRGEVTWSKAEGLGEYRAGVSLEKAELMGLSRVLRTV